MSDFNYSDISWAGHSSSSLGKDFLYLVDDCDLTQNVLIPTREDSILDLILTSECSDASFVGDVSSSCPLGKGDQNVVKFITQSLNRINPSKECQVFDYNKGDYNKFSNELNRVD